MADEFCLKMPDFHVIFRDVLHTVNLRHGADGFTSLPKEGVLSIFSPWKIRRLRSGLNPRTWVPKASTLPLEHRSRFIRILIWSLCTVWGLLTCTEFRKPPLILYRLKNNIMKPVMWGTLDRESLSLCQWSGRNQQNFSRCSNFSIIRLFNDILSVSKCLRFK